MDKAKAKKEISQLRQKRQNAIDNARITYLEGFIDGQKELEQYSFWFDQFNERYPDEVTKIMDSDIYSNHQTPK